jgi:hypothetical protein
VCVIAAKYFPDIGWVGVKQRDRNYVPKLDFQRDTTNGIERLMYTDEMTGYREGLNSNGICILSASLKVTDDEKEIEKSSSKHSGDGVRISKALTQPTITRAVKSCLDSKLTGNTIIFDKDRLFLIEACTKPCEEGETSDYTYKLKEIKKDDTVARTNHGIDLKWAGYQPVGDSAEKLSRKSSEARLKIARAIVNKAKTPEQIMDLLTTQFSKDPQMNATRTSSGPKKMRTTAQIMMIPSKDTLYLRPVASRIDIDTNDAKDPKAKTHLVVMPKIKI